MFCTKLILHYLKSLLNDSSSVRANLLFDRNPDQEKSEKITEKVEPVLKEPTIDLNADTIKIDIAQVVDIKPKYETSVDIDKIKVKHYEQVPDLDSFIQQKYLENDNKSLKTQLVDDPDDISNWVITEQQLDAVTSTKVNPILKPIENKFSSIDLSNVSENNEIT